MALIVFSGSTMAYYPFIFAAYFVIFAPILYGLCKVAKKQFFPKMHLSVRKATAVALLLAVAWNFVSLSEKSELLRPKSSLPQFQVKDYIVQTGIKNPTLLNYGVLDRGFYTAVGVPPTCRFFCVVNCPIPEMVPEQNRFVREGLVDFIVRLYTPEAGHENDDPLFAKYRFAGQFDDFALYELRDLSPA